MTKSEIFTAAHKLAKTFEGNYIARFVLALEIIRNGKSLEEKVITNIELIEAKFNTCENFSKKSYNQNVSIWQKYGKSRLYIPRNAYEQAGYIDLLTGEKKETRPGNCSILNEVIQFINTL